MVPVFATTLMDDRLLARLLDISGPFQLCLLLELCFCHVSSLDGFDELQAHLDHILGRHDNARVAGGSVRAKNSKEIGKSVHGHSHIHLCTATLFEDLI